MKNEWILDVLRDLKTFAELNGLDGLAAKLEETSGVATTEMRFAGLLTGMDHAPTANSDRHTGRCN